MEPSILTTKQVLTSLGILISVVTGGAATDYYLAHDIPIAHVLYIGYEYSQLKPALIERFKNRGQNPLNPLEFQGWADVMNREIKQCGSISVPCNPQTVYDDINNKIEAGQC